MTAEADEPAPGEPREIPRIGGWLILVAFGLCASTIVSLVQIAPTLTLLDRGTWDLTIRAHADGHTARAMVMFAAVAQVVVMSLQVAAIIMFFKRSRRFPRLYITMMITSLGALLVEAVLATRLGLDQVVGQDLINLFRGMIGTALWGTYLVQSKRARATFVR